MTEYVYAVMDDKDYVVNIVTADNGDAEQMLRMLIPEAASIVLTTDETGPAFIGGDMLDGRFRWPQPFPSWVWDSDAWTWTAPIPYPEGGSGYVWDEATVSWMEIAEPEPMPGAEVVVEPEPAPPGE